MRFSYSKNNLHRAERRLHRFLEVLPGAVSWTIILAMTALSFLKPLLVAVIIVVFLLYWLLRMLYLNILLIVSYVRLSVEKNADWMELIKGLKEPRQLLKAVEKRSCKGLRGRLARLIRRRQITRAVAADTIPNPDDIRHLIIYPVVKETREIVEPGIRSIAEGQYPAKKVLLVLAVEARASDGVKNDMHQLADQYRSRFMDFLVVEHPADIPGESRVKGANATYAAREAALYFDRKGIDYANVLVSCFDADTVAHPEYLACLTYYFMVTPNRTRASYQPIPVYYNNLWEVPSFARIIDIGSSFFQLVEATNPEKLVTFSSHSMSFKALVDVGYWPVDMISDDSAIFWKSFIYYDGHYQVVPMYTTVSMDIASGKSWLQTFENIYKQKRRWAWGVENFPLVMRAFLKSSKISVYKRIVFGWRIFESFVSWATWSFLLSVVTWLPAMFAGRAFESTTVYYMAPRIKNVIFTLSFSGIIVCMVISLLLLPSSGARLRRFSRKILHVFEWILIPFVVLVLSAVPALDAQTRLMLGRHLEFQVTTKRRSRKS